MPSPCHGLVLCSPCMGYCCNSMPHPSWSYFFVTHNVAVCGGSAGGWQEPSVVRPPEPLWPQAAVGQPQGPAAVRDSTRRANSKGRVMAPAHQNSCRPLWWQAGEQDQQPVCEGDCGGAVSSSTCRAQPRPHDSDDWWWWHHGP